MKKSALLLLLLVQFALPVALLAESKVVKNPTFELLSGTWDERDNRWRRFTTEDKVDMARFALNYTQKAKLLFHLAPKAMRIPRVMHFIWLGPKEFPKESIPNLKAWHTLHPDWRMLFWTDSEARPCPIKGMEKHLVDEIHFTQLRPFLEKTKNYGEKADLIRYEIIYQQGGLYVDHDVYPYKSFDRFHSAFDFFVGLENPHTNSGSKTKVFPCNCLFGARPFHPILKRTIDKVVERWEIIEALYPADDPKTAKTRVLSRTFHSFTLATKECLNLDGNADMVLPSSFFFAYKLFGRKTIQELKESGLVYARHEFAAVWVDKEKKKPKKQQKKSQKQNSLAPLRHKIKNLVS